MRQGGHRRLCEASLAIVCLLGGLSFVSFAQVQAVPDAQIEANVLKSLAGEPKLANENIISNTVNGTVTLSGTVNDEATRVTAENLASRTNGVVKVVDQLTLSAAGDQNQGTNPTLQSDGTLRSDAAMPSGGVAAQASEQHAPDPDTYAAQHGTTGQASGQSMPPDDASVNGQPGNGQPGNGRPANNQPEYHQPANDQPGYRQPYEAGNGIQNDSQNTASQQNSPQYPSNGQQPPYPQRRPAYSPAQAQYPQQGDAPPRTGPQPYGAQIGGEPVTVPAGALLRIRLNEGLDSRHSQPGTPFDAVVLNDVVADGAVAIPRGASVQGTVTDARSGGAIKGRGQIALQLHQVTLGGRTFPITSDVWSLDSSDKSGQTIGNAVGLGAFGAIIGAVAGGGPGAAIGAVAGGAAGVGTSAASGGRDVLVPSEAIIAFHLSQPAPLTTISQAEMDRLSYGVPTGAQQAMRRREPPPPYYGPVTPYYGPYYPRPYPY